MDVEKKERLLVDYNKGSNNKKKMILKNVKWDELLAKQKTHRKRGVYSVLVNKRLVIKACVFCFSQKV